MRIRGVVRGPLSDTLCGTPGKGVTAVWGCPCPAGTAPPPCPSGAPPGAAETPPRSGTRFPATGEREAPAFPLGRRRSEVVREEAPCRCFTSPENAPASFGSPRGAGAPGPQAAGDARAGGGGARGPGGRDRAQNVRWLRTRRARPELAARACGRRGSGSDVHGPQRGALTGGNPAVADGRLAGGGRSQTPATEHTLQGRGRAQPPGPLTRARPEPPRAGTRA